jgi:hypothetical protein
MAKVIQLMQTIKFRTAIVTIDGDKMLSTFKDGTENSFDLGWVMNDAEYRGIAEKMGYFCPRAYAIEHDLGHHFMADNLAWDYSWALHTNTWFPEPWPNHIAWEEHLVKSFQRYVTMGVVDKERVLEHVFGLDGRLKWLENRFSSIMNLLAEGHNVDYSQNNDSVSYKI